MVHKVSKTARGFTRIEFVDADGEACSLQASSEVADTREDREKTVWFGLDAVGYRMYLTQSQVAELLPTLVRFVKTGDLV